MGRLKELRKYINDEINKINDTDERTAATVHLYGVSLAAVILAKKRGLDEELAAMAAMLHDLYAYKTASYDDHAHKGAELAKIECAKKLFNNISTSKVRYHEVTDYQNMLDEINSLK